MNQATSNIKKISRILSAIIVLTAFIAMLAIPSGAAGTDFNPKSTQEAFNTAQKSHQFLCILFYDKKDENYRAMENEMTNFVKKSPQKILTYQVVTTNPKETDTIAKYRINQAPLPVLLVFAPNRAVTGGFPQRVSEEQLTKCLVSDLMMNILKPIQDGKITLVLLQNKKTKFNKESTAAANEFSKETGIKGNVAIVKADPNEPQNQEFWRRYIPETELSEAVIISILSTGQIAGIYKGKTSKEALLEGITSALNSRGCCGG